MAVSVTCPNPGCGAVANVEEQSLGRRGRCRKCGHVFALVRPGDEPGSGTTGESWKGSASADPTNLPEQFGRYRIMKLLGQGGMGAVYLAHDTKLNRKIALKVPYFHPADGPQAIQRFEREALSAATLDHPSICPVHDVGEIDGVHYLTMPYIEGRPLTEAIDRDKLIPEAQAASVVRKLALALQEAHAKGVIHRDLKPANILVNRRRELVIMDFGLARMAGSDEGALTKTGHVLGTALYMAPEQAAGDVAAVGPTADIYSLGVILHELLTGVRPFEGPWSLVIGLKTVMEPDPPSKHRPDLSPALDAICRKAIAKAPKDRYQTMTEFADALGGYMTVATAPTTVETISNSPPPSPESLASRFFAGIVSSDTISLRDEYLSSVTKQEDKDTPPRSPFRIWIAAAEAAAAVILLGVIIYVATNKGRLKIEIDDPNAVVKIDGEVISIEGLGEPIALRAGEHNFAIRWANGQFKTDNFTISRGEVKKLEHTYEPRVKGIEIPQQVKQGLDETVSEIPALPSTNELGNRPQMVTNPVLSPPPQITKPEPYQGKVLGGEWDIIDRELVGDSLKGYSGMALSQG